MPLKVNIEGWKEKIREALTSGCQGMIFLVAMSSAKGANKDIDRMAGIFGELNFAVFPMPNLLANELKDLSQAIAGFQFPQTRFFKYVAFYFAGHGGINRSNGDSFIQAVKPRHESDRVYISSDIINVIQLGQKEKCLLFFFDCCMSLAPDDGKDALPTINFTRSNILVARAASFGEKSFGTKDGGGYWTSTLCKYLGDNDLLVAILTKTKSDVEKKYGQRCKVEDGTSWPVNLKGIIIIAMYYHPV